VFGFWGVWDYFVKIPRAEMQSSRAVVLRSVKNGLDTPLNSEYRVEALGNLSTAIEHDDRQDDIWSASLETMRSAISGGDISNQRKATAIVEEQLQEYGSVTAPNKYDRPIQWLFILSMPFGFYYLWKYWSMSKRASVFRLEDDGTLSTPGGTWSSEEIVDIDMSRWVAKTGNARSTWTAKVVLADGTNVLLDDYIYQDMHLIIGTFAHQFYPDDWTPLAKRIKREVVEEEDNDEIVEEE